MRVFTGAARGTQGAPPPAGREKEHNNNNQGKRRKRGRPPRRVGKENTTSVPVETGAYDVPPSGWRRLTKTLPPAVFNCTQPSLLSLRPLDPCRFGSGRRDATLRRVRRTVLFAVAACV